MCELSDQECLDRIRVNPRDALAYRILVERHDPHLQRYLTASGVKHADVQEVCQETWLCVLKGLNERITAQTFRAWLLCIGRNQMITLVRKKKIRVEIAIGAWDLADKQPDHVHTVGFKEQLERCVEQLPVRWCKFVQRLLALESPDEIAKATGLKKSRVHQIKHEIKKSLEKCLERKL